MEARLTQYVVTPSAAGFVYGLSKQIESVLGPNGILAGSIDGYEHRQQQIRMARKSMRP